MNRRKRLLRICIGGLEYVGQLNVGKVRRLLATRVARDRPEMARCSSSNCEIAFAKVDLRDGPFMADSTHSLLNKIMSVVHLLAAAR